MFSTKDAVISDIKSGAGRIKDEAHQTTSDVRSDLESAANRAGRTVRQYIDSASDELQHAADTVTTQIRTKPVQSSLVALAAGFVLGALFRR